MLGTTLIRSALVGLVVVFLMSSNVSALGSDPVISHVMPGDTTSATNEFIAIYNNSDTAVNVSGWCVAYASSSDVTKTTLACLDEESDGFALFLEPFRYVRFSSAGFAATIPGFNPDKQFNSGLSATAGHIRLLDNNKKEIDRLGWGSAVSPEKTGMPAPANGQIITRKLITDTSFYVDTNDNSDDFTLAILESVPSSGIFEQQVATDICANIAGFQTTIPDHFLADELGGCYEDVCDNIDGLQQVVPDGYDVTEDWTCEELVIPGSSAVILITEMLPNVASTDTGNEFIELYNPNQSTVNLKGYTLQLGPSFAKEFVFDDVLVDPLSYVSFSDLFTKLTLPNSSASARVVAPDKTVVSETDPYEEPRDDEAWALINDVWQYTSLATPGLKNLGTPAETAIEDSEELADCGPGKFRNPETNRCKSIEVGDVELKPCDPGQIRNPETNRCRSATSASGLVACKAGQERNPATNRCRSIVRTASSLKPCAKGQERNPETNRCRKVATLGSSTTAVVKDVPSNGLESGGANWMLIGGIAALALGYAAYEWRTELKNFTFKLFKK